MNTERKKVLIEHIKNRRNITPPMASMERMLENAGVKLFAPSCFNRIVDADLIDNEHEYWTIYQNLTMSKWTRKDWSLVAVFWRASLSRSVYGKS